MLKARKISIMMLVTMVLMFIASFGLELKANAVFDNHFNVTWDNGTDKSPGSSNVASAANNMDGAFKQIIDKYKTAITFISAIGAVTMIAIFIINFMKLGTTSGNPTERSKCITALIWSGLAAAGLGSVALVVGIFYGALKE